MSLNGLDEAAVTEAYQAALAEAGGWFLLKYSARDAVDLLGRGTGGVAEVKNAVERYEEKSPLYGFVQYRRRKVILKYVPDGTSRLLQGMFSSPRPARLTVQFSSIVEKFTPNDAIFAFTSSTDLTDSALSSVCLSHASANSLTSSSSSLRRKRLGEITESAEETGGTATQKRSDLRTTTLEVDDSHRHGRGEPSPLAKTTTADEIGTPEKPSSVPAKEQDEAATSPPVLERVTPKSIPLIPPKSAPYGDVSVEHKNNQYPESRPSLEPRRSTQSVRLSPYDFETSSLYSGYGGFKKKVKLGPRPSVDVKGRPKTSHSQSGGSFDVRPVAALPASVRQARPQQSSSRPTSRRSERSQIASQARFQQAPEEYPSEPVPPTANIPLAPLYRPNLVEGSVASTSSRSVTSSAKPPGITPEKQRLMKALQMRKRQMAEKARQEEDRLRQTEIKEEEEEMGQTAEHAEKEGTGFAPETKTVPAPVTEVAHAESSDDSRQNGVTSPVSTLETSEGPSTQGSSFTEDIDRSTLDTQDHSSGSESPQVDGADKKPQVEIPETSQDQASKEDEIASTETITSPKLGSPHSSIAEVQSVRKPLMDATAATVVETVKVNDNAKVSLTPILALPEHSVPTPKVNLDNTAALESGEPLEDGDALDQKLKKAKASLEPIKVLPAMSSPDVSDVSEDESFMAELDQATVHEAKPISVSRSPITPVFGRNMQHSSMADQSSIRSGSRSGVDGTEGTSIHSGRTIVGRWPPTVEIGPALTVKKVNVSSGISKRIRALEMFSSRESSTSPTQEMKSSPANNATNPMSPLSTFRKRTSFINKNMAPNMSTTTPPPATLPYPSPAPTPEPRPTPSRQVSNPNMSPRKKRESVSVTARIIRTSDGIEDASNGPTDFSGALNLHRSPLTIEREKSETSIPSSRKSVEIPMVPRTESPELTKREKRFSLSSSASFQKISNSGLLSGRASMGDRQRPSESALTRSTSETSSTDAGDDRKESRTSRLRKRMSLIASTSRRSIASALSPPPKEHALMTPTIPEGIEQGGEELIHEGIPHEVDIGDVNVQFPDTLLWKRRFMRVDDQGYIILTPPTMEANHRNISKRYHLSEFRKPTVPDLERQELPHSILLDFEDGSTLQCACESKYTQQQVLRMLVDAHSAYHQLYSQ